MNSSNSMSHDDESHQPQSVSDTSGKDQDREMTSHDDRSIQGELFEEGHDGEIQIMRDGKLVWESKEKAEGYKIGEELGRTIKEATERMVRAAEILNQGLKGGEKGSPEMVDAWGNKVWQRRGEWAETGSSQAGEEGSQEIAMGAREVLPSTGYTAYNGASKVIMLRVRAGEMRFAECDECGALVSLQAWDKHFNYHRRDSE